jgi:hypothetical protein
LQLTRPINSSDVSPIHQTHDVYSIAGFSLVTTSLAAPSSSDFRNNVESIDDDDSGPTADGEDPPAPFDPSEFEGGEEKLAYIIETTDDEAPPRPFDPCEFVVDEEARNKENSNDTLQAFDYEEPPRPFDPCEFEVDKGARTIIRNNILQPTAGRGGSITAPPQYEEVKEEQARSRNQSISIGRAVFPNSSNNSVPPNTVVESRMSPFDRHALSLGAEAGTHAAYSSLQSVAPASRYALDAGTVDDDSLGIDAIASGPALERNSTFHVPVAWPVTEADEGEVIIATRPLPWWKQRRIQLMIIALGALSIALGVTLSRPSNDGALSLSSFPSSSPHPSSSPSWSNSPSASPTAVCDWINISIVYDTPDETSWELSKKEVNDTWTLYNKGSSHTHRTLSHEIKVAETLCLQEGEYKFEIFDTGLNGICCFDGQGNYSLITSNGDLIAEGAKFWNVESESTTFSIPFFPTLSVIPSISRSPSSSSPPTSSLPSMTPTSSVSPSLVPSSSLVPTLSSAPTKKCYWIDISIVYDDYPEETWWELWKIVEEEPSYEFVKLHDALPGDINYTKSLCLEDGEYKFTIFDVWLNGLCCDLGVGHYNVTTSRGVLIAEGRMFTNFDEITFFTIPFVVAPSAMPSMSRSPASASSSTSAIPSVFPSSLSFPSSSYAHVSSFFPTECTLIEYSILYNQYPINVFGDAGGFTELWRRSERIGGYEKVYYHENSFDDVSHIEQLCLQEGEYQLIILDNDGGKGCTFCEGQYNISTLDGDLLAMGIGGFGFTTKNRFSLPPTSTSTPIPTAESDCNVLDVIVTLDQHPSDIRWEILSSAQGFTTIVAMSPPYDASMELKADKQSFCLADGMYQFTIHDDYTDGS